MSSDRSDENDIFIGKIIDYRPNGVITHFSSTTSDILIAIGCRQLFHITLQNISQNIEIVLPLSTHDRIANVYTSQNGIHALISSTGAESFYVNLKKNQCKPLKRLKGHAISAVGWNLEAADDSDTGFILLGTTKGIVMESNIQSNGNLEYLKELSPNFTFEKDLPITSIIMHQCEEDSDGQRWAAVICVPGRLYCLSAFIKKLDQGPAQPVVGSIWSSAFVEQTPGFLQPLFPSKGSHRYHCMDETQRTLPSSLAIYPASLNGEQQTKFCWVGADGYTLGSINFSQTEGYDMVIEKAHIKHKLVNGRYDYPLDVVLTEYHVLLLYSDRLEAVSLLNNQCTFERFMGTESGQLKGLCRNPTQDIFWIYTDSAVWRFRTNEEARKVWRIYLDNGEYGKARAITSRLKDKLPYQLVIKKEANKFIAEKNFTAAAEILVESSDPFEITVLKFLSTKEDRRSGLKRYLDLKLNNMNATEGRTRRDAAVLWLLEVQLSELSELKRCEDSINTSVEQMQSSEIHLRNVRQQLELFLARPVTLETVETNLEAVYRLMVSHADFDSQLFLAQKLKDFDKVINIHLLRMDYKKAFDVIVAQHVPMLFYKYSPLLIEHLPFEIVLAWIDEGKNLNPDLLLPSLYRCQNAPKMIAAAFKYINFAINLTASSAALHNFMISLCAAYKPKILLSYFKKYGYDKSKVPYDVEFALRICLEREELNECCVHLYCVDDLYDEAVGLALTFDLEMAKECAKRMTEKELGDNDSVFSMLDNSKSKFSLEMRRRIWLKIAKFVVEQKQDVLACMNLLKESNNVIKIQDLLPFFPEFATIDLFKDPLCECLKEHSGKIKELRKDMKEATDSAKRIRTDMEKIKNKSTVIRSCDICCLCNEQALSRPLFVFTCKHFFHRNCLEEEVKSSWKNEVKKEYSMMVEKEKLLNRKLERVNDKYEQPNRKKKADLLELFNLRVAISNLLASQCILCGPDMIDSIDKPFFTADEYKIALDSW